MPRPAQFPTRFVPRIARPTRQPSGTNLTSPFAGAPSQTRLSPGWRLGLRLGAAGLAVRNRMMIRFALLTLGCALLAAPTPFGDAAEPATPWTAPHFSIDARALYEAASALNPPEGASGAILDDEDSYVFDAAGRAISTHYAVFKVLTQQGANDQQNVAATWEPWHEERPIIRARVITPDFNVHELDPKTITDSPEREAGPDMYSDRRVTRAPLPSIAPGSVIEEETVINQTAPLFVGGTVRRHFLSTPVQHARLTLEAPSSLPLRYTTQLLPDVQPQRSESEGKVKLIFDLGPRKPLDVPEDYLPSDVPMFPSVAFSTGAAWEEVADAYSAAVDSHLAADEVKSLAGKLTAGLHSPSEKEQAIVQYLDKEVRYTGIEFGEASIVPHSSAETLAHKYGDCKDKSTLLVALLRAAGVPAYVALLDAGDRMDVPPDLPGMGLFDHAIVYVPGEPDLWVDATDEYARLGQLPMADQGRLALIARSGSKALARTPEALSRDNVMLELREIDLSENGPARVMETSQPRGIFESNYRGIYVDEQSKQARENLSNYVQSMYLAEKLDRFHRSDPADLSKPFELVLECEKAKRGFTDLDSAAAGIRLEGLFAPLPGELQRRAGQGDEKSNEDASKNKKQRTADYQLPTPYVAEWQYKIVPPVGFEPAPLPKDANIALGPATLTEQFTADNKGTVRAVIRFDTTQRRLTVAEATELRNKVAELRESEAILIGFQPVAKALLAQGKVREAFRSYHDLVDQHPKEAIHHLQFAKALLDAGMGEAARDEARRAIKLEPRSALAEKTLAQILRYDTVGRELRSGSDIRGSAEAYRAAAKLDPEDKSVIAGLAIALEYNDRGERYGPGAKLQEAVAEYGSLSKDDLPGLGLEGNLAFALFYAGQFAAACKNAEALNPQPKALIIACEAATEGSAPALADANKRFGGETNFQDTLKTAGQMLMSARQYAPAADVFQAGASGDNASRTMGLAAMLRKARLHESLQFENKPRDVVLHMALLALDPSLTVDKMKSVSSRNAIAVIENSDPQELQEATKAGKAFRRAMEQQGLSPDAMLDVVLELMEPTGEGNDAVGYRETLQMPEGKTLIFYVVREAGEYKILDSSEKPNAIGLEILDRVAAHDLAGARTLLDWVREDQHLGSGDDPLSGPAFPRLWTKGKEADANQMKLAAAAMLAQTKPTARQGVSILEEARKAAAGDTEKTNIDLALVAGDINLQNYQELLEVSSPLAQKYPESKTAFIARSLALLGLGRFDEAEALAQERLKRLTNDLEAMRMLVKTAVLKGDPGGAFNRSMKIVDAGKAEAVDLNNLAWYSLFFDREGGPDLDSALKASRLDPNDPHALHTLGCVYAAAGKPKEAREVLLQGMDLDNLDEPNPDYWYALGLIAEQYGLREIALSDYAKVIKPQDALKVPDSSYHLAQTRTKALHGGG
jgi:tetratricopeptide (TPR) repeat protein/transglutaminase-like putative cysteine protease